MRGRPKIYLNEESLRKSIAEKKHRYCMSEKGQATMQKYREENRQKISEHNKMKYLIRKLGNLYDALNM